MKSARAKVSTVTVSEPVDGTKHRRRPDQYSRNGPTTTVKVHPEVMKTARGLQQPGQRIYIVSETEVVVR